MSNAPSQMALNLEIRVLMVRRGKRQSDVAEALGNKQQSQVARRLAGEIEWKFSELVALADVLEIPFLDLLALSIPSDARVSA